MSTPATRPGSTSSREHRSSSDAAERDTPRRRGGSPRCTHPLALSAQRRKLAEGDRRNAGEGLDAERGLAFSAERFWWRLRETANPRRVHHETNAARHVQFFINHMTTDAQTRAASGYTSRSRSVVPIVAERGSLPTLFVSRPNDAPDVADAVQRLSGTYISKKYILSQTVTGATALGTGQVTACAVGLLLPESRQHAVRTPGPGRVSGDQTRVERAVDGPGSVTVVWL